MGKTLALDWARHGIRVNTVAPGYVTTDLTSGLQQNEGLRRSITDRTPLNRMAKPAEIADLVVFLASDSSRCSCYQIAEILFDLYLSQREKDGAPRRVLLDFDSTDDPTHGEQEGSYYHGYYRQHIYHPLLVFDGHSGHLITTLLRAGNTHSSRSCVAVLRRIVGRLRQRWPGVAIEIRADAGFAVPALYDYCEREGISYTIALITNERLKEMAHDLLEEATQEHERTDKKATLFGDYFITGAVYPVDGGWTTW